MIKLADNNFNVSRPAKSGNAFADASPTVSTNTFASSKPTVDNQVFAGDNTTDAPYGGDFGTYGGLYGQDNYGSISHFQARRNLPSISH